MSKIEYPNISIVLSHELFLSFPWFLGVRDFLEESKCCKVSTEDTLPNIVYWTSSGQDFVDDQMVLTVTLAQLTSMSKDMAREIETWPSKYGNKFLTLMVFLEPKESIRNDVESRIVAAQLDSHFNVRPVYSASDAYQLLLCMTKATAEKHSKILRHEVLGFEGGKRTATTGNNAWVAFLEMFFSQAANPLAKAVASEYPSVSCLRRELLRKPVTEVFERIRVSVGEPPLQRTFKIGPETANKIYNFFTQDDPEFIV